MNPSTRYSGARVAILLSFVAVCGCSTPGIDTYRQELPKLDLRTWFVGHQEAWGVVQSRSGEVIKRFHVDISGRLDDGKIILDEQFSYADGTSEQRQWQLVQVAPNRWIGHAGDVVGAATGETAGNTLHWQYTLSVPVNGKRYDVEFDDWMYLIDERTMVNRTTMRKFKIGVGQVTLFFRKLS
jgi:hypothetical protein